VSAIDTLASLLHVEDQVRVQPLKPGWGVSAGERGETTPHDLHVLLRHRLLRQPGGFEGLSLLLVEREANGLAVSKAP